MSRVVSIATPVSTLPSPARRGNRLQSARNFDRVKLFLRNGVPLMGTSYTHSFGCIAAPSATLMPHLNRGPGHTRHRIQAGN